MELRSFYKDKIEKYAGELGELKKKAFAISMIRLLLFAAIVASAYAAYPNSGVVVSIIIIGLTIFLRLVTLYVNLKNKRNFISQLLQINQFELLALDGKVEQFEAGSHFLRDDHHYNQDIDLFGPGSLYQALNRTGTLKGAKSLAFKLNENDIQQVGEKQKVLAELATKVEWRQHFQATGKIIEKEVDSEDIVKWVSTYEPKIPGYFARVPLLFSCLSFGVIGLYAFDIITGFYLGLWFFLGLGITGLFVKHVSKLSSETGKIQTTFDQYAKLIGTIERENFESSIALFQKNRLKESGLEVSKVLHQLSQSIGSLDQRNNVFFGIIANGFFLWDLRYTYRIEKWLSQYEVSINDWFDVVSEFDALNSLANYQYNHPDFCVPSIEENSNITIDSDLLGHPLINAEKRIANSFKLNREDFIIITGANMAGKSTFLRTVALNLVMANCGLAVCAKSFKYRPIKLISSMRTSDSLQNDESYFFSELKRLKFIVEEIKKDTYFIILDEILKGTNSKDKAEGSQKFVEKLVESNSTGLIATHDLSLCQLEHKLPQIKNHYFDAEIVDDELYFDYTFKEGVCQNMNASFLLKKMEIV